MLTLGALSPRDTPVSQIARQLRKKYFPRTLTDVDVAADSAEALLNELRAHFDGTLPTLAPIARNILPERMLEHVARRAFREEGASDAQVDASIAGGTFARYLDLAGVVELVRLVPGLALDGKFFALSYSAASESLRGDVAESIYYTLRDVQWLAEDASAAISKDANWRLRLARALASARLAQSWRA
jgi:hypothetical protein